MNINSTLSHDVKVVESWIKFFMEKIKSNSPNKIAEAMSYSIESDGKRLRPILLIETFKLFNSNIDSIKGFAFAIEAIHTYSLIHDDLPAMDDDDYRRGKLTNHKIHGEAIAILAGDALLNYAFEILLDEVIDNNTLLAAKLIAKSSGASGMIGGQVIDITSENKNISYCELQKLHSLKTGKLIYAAVIAGAILGGASKNEMEHLKIYAKKIGLAFQIVDDILDVEGNNEITGKLTGSDIANNKVTYISLFGVEKSQTLAQESVNEALDAISKVKNNQFFIELANYILSRKR